MSAVKSYRVRAVMPILVSTVVEAESKDEAIRLAMKRDLPNMRWCDSDILKEWATSGERSDRPSFFEAEEEKEDR